jgi:hypothetical protein
MDQTPPEKDRAKNKGGEEDEELMDPQSEQGRRKVKKIRKHRKGVAQLGAEMEQIERVQDPNITMISSA